MGRMLPTRSCRWIYHQRSCAPLCSLCRLQLCLLARLPGWGSYVKTSHCGIPHGVKMAARAQQQFRKSCRYLVYGSCTKEGFRNSDCGLLCRAAGPVEEMQSSTPQEASWKVSSTKPTRYCQ